MEKSKLRLNHLWKTLLPCTQCWETLPLKGMSHMVGDAYFEGWNDHFWLKLAAFVLPCAAITTVTKFKPEALWKSALDHTEKWNEKTPHQSCLRKMSPPRKEAGRMGEVNIRRFWWRGRRDRQDGKRKWERRRKKGTKRKSSLFHVTVLWSRVSLSPAPGELIKPRLQYFCPMMFTASLHGAQLWWCLSALVCWLCDHSAHLLL